MGERLVDELLPHLQHVRVAALQLDYVFPRQVGEGCVLVKALTRRLVEYFQIGQFRGRVRELVQVGDEHPKLRPPVTHVIVAHDFVAREFEDAGDGVADDCAAQMADVHFLGQVGMRVVDYDLLRRVLGHAESRIGQHVP